jgi:hypothetical protein
MGPRPWDLGAPLVAAVGPGSLQARRRKVQRGHGARGFPAALCALEILGPLISLGKMALFRKIRAEHPFSRFFILL